MKLPESFLDNEWWMLAPWSNLKHPKRWMRNKRLKKKFCKRRHCYLRDWVFYRYNTRNELMLEQAYKKAIRQI